MLDPAPSLRPLAVVCDYAQLHAALRRPAEEIGISRVEIDRLAGLADGHASKLLSPVPIKKLGHISLGPILSVLGLKIALIEDPEAVARTIRMAEPRQECHVGDPARKFRWRAERRAAAADAG
jgi:hypothetical protein